MDNLRLVDGTSVTKLEAMRNRTISSNTSGYTGVYRQKNSGKWAAQITFKNKTYYLGAYDNFADGFCNALSDEIPEYLVPTDVTAVREKGLSSHSGSCPASYEDYARKRKCLLLDNDFSVPAWWQGCRTESNRIH